MHAYLDHDEWMVLRYSMLSHIFLQCIICKRTSDLEIEMESNSKMRGGGRQNIRHPKWIHICVASTDYGA